MLEAKTILAIATFLAGLIIAVGLAVLLLHWRDRYAKSHGKTIAQVQARFSAIRQFRWTLELCIPGVLIMVFGSFYAIDRGRQHEGDWWIGLLFILAGLGAGSTTRPKKLASLSGTPEIGRGDRGRISRGRTPFKKNTLILDRGHLSAIAC